MRSAKQTATPKYAWKAVLYIDVLQPDMQQENDMTRVPYLYHEGTTWSVTAKRQGKAGLTIMILVNQWYPIFHKGTQQSQDGSMCGPVSQSFQLRSVDVRHSVRYDRTNIEKTHRVYESQMEPRKRYHSMSLSLRAYSERSRAEEGGGTRRKFRAINSSARATTKGLFERRSKLNRVAKVSRVGK